MKKWFVSLLKILTFFFSIGLVVYGHQSVGRLPLLIMLIGVAGLLILLYIYNRKFV